MKQPIFATSIGEITGIIDEVHDLCLDVEDLERQREGVVVLPLRIRPRDLPAVELRIHNVWKTCIVDTEHIQFYPINVLTFFDDKVTIECSVPIRIELFVTELCLEVTKVVDR